MFIIYHPNQVIFTKTVILFILLDFPISIAYSNKLIFVILYIYINNFLNLSSHLNHEIYKLYGGLSMNYTATVLKEDIIIKNIVTIHYFEFAKDYVFEGERHNFWEFLYVDKGEVEVMADSQGFKLKQGEMIFHKPNEFHNIWANGKVAPNLIVITFECNNKAMNFFRNKIINISDYEKNLLAKIIREAKEAFSSPLNISSLTKLERNQNSLFGCEQLIKTYLEQLLISLIRQGASIKSESRLSTAAKERSEDDMIKKILAYMSENIANNLTFDDICKFSCMSSTNLKILFKERVGMGVIEFFKNLKIEKAKKMMREEHYNFTEIAEKLGYTSIHYFSRHFKRVTGMTPSEYASSVKAKI